MSRGKAITLAVFTAWPFLYMVLFMCATFGMMFLNISGAKHSSGPHSNLPTFFFILFALHILTMLAISALLVIYFVHLFKSDKVPEDKKALWAVVLFLGNILAMPVYWYYYIWSEHKSSIAEPEI